MMAAAKIYLLLVCIPQDKHFRGLLDEDRRMKDDAPFSLQMPPNQFLAGKAYGNNVPLQIFWRHRSNSSKPLLLIYSVSFSEYMDEL
jgi:hypothetical protein